MFISLFFESGRCLVLFDSRNLGGVAGIPLVPLRNAAKSEGRKRRAIAYRNDRELQERNS